MTKVVQKQLTGKQANIITNLNILRIGIYLMKTTSGNYIKNLQFCLFSFENLHEHILHPHFLNF